MLAGAGGRFLDAGGTQQAAGIAFRVLFALAPLAIVLVSVLGLLLQDDDLRGAVVDRVVEVLPVDAAGRADVEREIERIATPASAAGFVGLAVLFWAASGMMAALRQGMDRVMGVEARPLARGKLVDFALVPAAALLVLGSVLVGLAPETRLLGDAQQYLGVLVPLVLWVATSVLLYRFVPAAGIRLVDALAGALAAAVPLLAIMLASNLIFSRTTRWSFIYGSLTGIFVFLYSVYLYATVVLFGAAVAAEWAWPSPAPSTEETGPLRVRARRALRVLFVGDDRSRRAR